jgi:hypothetical protein
MSTSRAYLAKRLKAIGRDDLLAAAERGEVTLHSAALWAGLITQQRVPEGNGSQNVSKRAAWALMKAERGTSPSAPRPESAPESAPAPVQPKFSQDTRDIIERLVAAGRSDLVLAIVERRISPFQAGRIAERGASETRRGVTENVTENATENVTKNATKNVTETSPRTVEPEIVQKPEKAKPEAKRVKPEVTRPDVRALIG